MTKKRDIEDVYEADGRMKLRPYLAIANRPRVIIDTPGALTVKIAELVPAAVIAELVGMSGAALARWHWKA